MDAYDELKNAAEGLFNAYCESHMWVEPDGTCSYTRWERERIADFQEKLVKLGVNADAGRLLDDATKRNVEALRERRAEQPRHA